MRVPAFVVVGAIFSVVWCPSCLSFVGRPTLANTRSLAKGTDFNRKHLSRQARPTRSSQRFSDISSFIDSSVDRKAAPITSATTTSLWAGTDTEGPSAAAAEEGTSAAASVEVEPTAETSTLPFFLDPSTRGGAVVVPVLSLLLPLGAYVVLTANGIPGSSAGAWVGVGYTLIGLIAWIGSYFFRVATKNMTYAVQLKNYEQAVIEKRFSELEEGEKDALLDEVNET